MLHVLIDIVVDTDDPDRAVKIMQAHTKQLREEFDLDVFSVFNDEELEKLKKWQRNQDLLAVRRGRKD
jgi:hypothetical protein